MNFRKYEFDARAGDVVEVTLSGQANVRLLDSSNFSRYQRGESHRYTGGLAKVSPYRLAVPSSGHWYVVVDLGGYAGSVNVGARLISRAAS